MSPSMNSPLRNGRGGAPLVPTPPSGMAVAAYPTYVQAQKAVDRLTTQDFPVNDVTIVGTDLQLVERVTGRLTRGKVIGAGAASGAWLGLFFFLMALFIGTPVNAVMLLVTVGIGALMGSLMGWAGYSMTKSRRDFTSVSQVVARCYHVLCQARSAERARTMLAQLELG